MRKRARIPITIPAIAPAPNLEPPPELPLNAVAVGREFPVAAASPLLVADAPAGAVNPDTPRVGISVPAFASINHVPEVDCGQARLVKDGLYAVALTPAGERVAH